MARDIDAEQAKSAESTGDSLVNLDVGRVDIDHHAMDASFFERRSRLCKQRIEQTRDRSCGSETRTPPARSLADRPAHADSPTGHRREVLSGEK